MIAKLKSSQTPVLVKPPEKFQGAASITKAVGLLTSAGAEKHKSSQIPVPSKLKGDLPWAINKLDPEILHDKHLYMKGMLESDTGGIPLASETTRERSFFEFIGFAINNKLACLIAQDLYPLCLCENNQILDSTGFQQRTDIHNFSIQKFTRDTMEFCQQDESTFTTVENKLFVEYISCCKARLSNNIAAMDRQRHKCPKKDC